MTTKLTHAKMDIFSKDRGFLENMKRILECLHILNLLRCYVVLRIETPTMEQSGLISILVGAARMVRTIWNSAANTTQIIRRNN